MSDAVALVVIGFLALLAFFFISLLLFGGVAFFFWKRSVPFVDNRCIPSHAQPNLVPLHHVPIVTHTGLLQDSDSELNRLRSMTVDFCIKRLMELTKPHEDVVPVEQEKKSGGVNAIQCPHCTKWNIGIARVDGDKIVNASYGEEKKD